MKTDSELQRDVLDELKWEPSINAAHIGVSVKDGIAILSGHVDSYWERFMAERAAKRVRGVKAIANEIEVVLPGISRRSDEDIAAAVVKALQSHVGVPEEKIKVTVSQGWVKLEGEVEWGYQKDDAEHAVRSLSGVTGVSNLIAVKPRVAPTELKAKIEDAFRRSAELDARRISVEVDGGKVILRGTVRLVRREIGGHDGGLVGPGGLQRREPDHRRTVATHRDEDVVTNPRPTVLSGHRRQEHERSSSVLDGAAASRWPRRLRDHRWTGMGATRFLLVVLPRPIKEQRGGDPDLRRRGRLSHRGGEPDRG